MTVKPFKIITKYYLTEFGQYAARLILLLPIGEKGDELAIEYQNRTIACVENQLSFRWGDRDGGAYNILGELGLSDHDRKFYRCMEMSSPHADTLDELEEQILYTTSKVREVLRSVVSGYLERVANLPANKVSVYNPLNIN
jgi:hypothetical protein